jgi:hypothetical protein
MARNIESPGVQLSEIDISLNASLPVGTNILINGFTDQGPSQELLNVTSIEEYEQIYGVPTNSAERYSYHTIKNILTTPAKVVFNRLPYGTTGGDGFNYKYTALMYPIYTSGGAPSALSGEGEYFIGTPTQTTVSESEYNEWKQGSIDWATTTFDVSASSGISGAGEVGEAGLVIVNKIQTSVNQDFEGYYVALSDNAKSNTTAGATDFEFDSITAVQTSKSHDVSGNTVTNAWTPLADSRLSFELTGNASDKPNSISESIESAPTWDFGDEEYDDAIIISVYKMRRSGYATNQNALTFIPQESFIGSLGAGRKYTQPTGFQETSFFVETLANDTSTFLDVMVNPNFSAGNWVDDAGIPNRTVRVISDTESTADTSLSGAEADAAYTLGLYQETVNEVKEIGDIPTKLDLGLRLAEDWDVLPLDIVLDAGLSTIHTTMKSLSGVEFNDIKPVSVSSLSDVTTGAESPEALAWLTIYNKFNTFCQDTRQDCMFIADVYRNILVNGKDFKTLADKSKNFSQHVYTPLKNLTAKCNSSYSATYAQWIKVYDNQTSDYAWIPYSGFQGSIMSRLDSTLFPWSAPAGLENGNVVGALDIALATTQKQRDLLYRNNLNAVVFFPSDGIVCWGQKTLQKKPSAFDRINVRRLFLTLEKSTRDLMKYFVFQPNTTFTRTRVVNILTPVFDVAKNNEGVYDYLIVCDERNNTPAVIDANELQVDIYLKPVRTAEFILVNFYATRTDQNFSELI